MKMILNSASDIPEGMAKEYVEKDGKFHLVLDKEMVPKADLTEFRNNNINLLKDKETLQTQLTAVKTKFDGVDLDAYRTAMTLQQEKDDKKLLDADGVEALVDKRTERMRADFEGQNKALLDKNAELTTDNGNLSGQLSNVLIDSQIHLAVNEVGKPREGAMQDILNRGRGLFKLIDGKPTPIGIDNNPIFGKDGKAPMTFKEWANGLQESSGFLFETAIGGGGQGNRSGGAHNPSKTIAAGDPVAFGNNLENIASGKVAVK